MNGRYSDAGRYANLHYQVESLSGSDKQFIKPVRRMTQQAVQPKPQHDFLYRQQEISPGEYHDQELDRFFSDDTVKLISSKITQYLKGVREDGKDVVLHPDRIRDLMGTIFSHSKAGYAHMVDNCITKAVSQLRDEIEMIQQNNKLSIWTSNYLADPSDYNLSRVPKIYVNERRAKGGFNMNF